MLFIRVNIESSVFLFIHPDFPISQAYWKVRFQEEKTSPCLFSCLQMLRNWKWQSWTSINHPFFDQTLQSWYLIYLYELHENILHQSKLWILFHVSGPSHFKSLYDLILRCWLHMYLLAWIIFHLKWSLSKW